ncbi:PREDICTED: nucleolar protein 6 [Ceratosolen solmsi marchali]|uniref:Nucleolar protein 6 n=1 Tax=Ceratosolen solmsi marchali TaxID=326594 RepID=A0AAJ6YGV8_9HYME|nr:PREDICTED: nucleolar protein 6 [Ceratosolen solmsi marchali]
MIVDCVGVVERDRKQSEIMESEGIVSSENELENDRVPGINGRKRKGTDDLKKPKKKRSKEKNDLYKRPTVEELNQLRETENLFHSNLFRLQIEEVLSAVKVSDKYNRLFKLWFEKFENHLNSMEDNVEIELNNDTLFEDCDVRIPMKKLPNDCAGTFKFLTPSKIMVGGSYAIDTVIGPDATIDVLIEMPRSLFRRSDSKNYVYMRKKAMYLAFIGHKLDKELVQSMCFMGNHSNPILKIIPSGKLSKRCVVYAHLVVQDTTFPLTKLIPQKNNVKSNWFFKSNDNDVSVTTSPTPHYNSTIMYDLTTLQANVHNIKVIKEYPNIRDGIILLKIWLKQRDFSNNFETFNGHVITMYVLYLLYTKKLNTFMSSYQIVRNTWQYLAQVNWCQSGISLCRDEEIKERIVDYHKYYDCVFLDSTGYHNLASNVVGDTFKWIANQAELSLQCLNNTRINGFQILFMRKVNFYNIFDQIVCFYNAKALKNIVKANSDNTSELNFGSNKYIQIVKFISKFLKEGLGNRISLINIFPRKLKEWELNQEIPDDVDRLHVGFQLNPNYCFSIIEKGPGANLPEAHAFRKFWGDKSELRRFKDGTVCEAVIWANENATSSEKRQVPQQIIKYLLEQKLYLFEQVHFFFLSNQIEEFLSLKKVQVPAFQYSNEEASLQAIVLFDSLKKQLSNLTDLPLEISGVQGCSPVCRYTAVFPPLARFCRADGVNVIAGKTHLRLAEEPKDLPLYHEPIEAVLQMCISGKWPDELEALRMTKAAFYLQIAENLRKESKLSAHGSLNHIDVLKDGLPFRLRIASQKEIGLLKQLTDEDGVKKYRDTEESMELEAKLFHLPKITGALSGLHRQQPSFGPACCLVKRWLSSQLIDESHMPGIVVELLMAAIYLEPLPYESVQQPQVAFLRFLESFAREHWSTDPVLVNFNNEMTREETVDVENYFGTSMGTLPPLFIVTPYDRRSSAWTRKAPNTLILNRISDLSKEVLRIVEIQLSKATSLLCGSLFVPSLAEYDCLIRLKDSLNPRRFQAVDVDDSLPTVELLPVKNNYVTKMPVVDFVPVAEYLRELRSIYNDFALFFHDTYGGSVIGVLLRPLTNQERDFKVTNVHCHKLNDNGKLILNVSAMIEDFYILGNGLVETIDIQSTSIDTT